MQPGSAENEIRVSVPAGIAPAGRMRRIRQKMTVGIRFLFMNQAGSIISILKSVFLLLPELDPSKTSETTGKGACFEGEDTIGRNTIWFSAEIEGDS
jgi:hypothetical protein